ncbi:hypothetical protein ACIHEI_34015 [Kitasatospora sp. NPDC051984]
MADHSFNGGYGHTPITQPLPQPQPSPAPAPQPQAPAGGAS